MSGQINRINIKMAISSLDASNTVIKFAGTVPPVLPEVASSLASIGLLAPGIESLLPHSGTMVLLDRLIAADEERLCAQVVIRPDSLFMGPEGVGSWIGIEYMAQSIAAFAGYKARLRGESAKVGFLLGTRRYDVSCALFPPGAVLWIMVKRVMQADNGLGSFECAIYEATTSADRNNGPIAETVPFDAIDHTLGNAKALVRATITVFQPHDVTGFLEGKVE